MLLAVLHNFWPNLLALLVLGYLLRAAWHRGLIASVLDLVGFGASLGVATIAYVPLANELSSALQMSRGVAKSLAFMAIWWTAGYVFAWLVRLVVRRLPQAVALSRWNRLSGLATGVLEFVVIMSFAFSLLAALPLPEYVSADIDAGLLSGPLSRQAASIERLVSRLYGGAFQETLSFLTTDNYSDRLDLGFKTAEMTVVPEAEQRMLELVNAERVKNGLPAYVWDGKLSELARLHSADMLVRGYFSHATPDGQTALQRAAAMDDLRYRALGENIAYAKDLTAAHAGLLASPGHRANILSSVFSRVGIGIEAVPGRGLMVTQEFAD